MSQWMSKKTTIFIILFLFFLIGQLLGNYAIQQMFLNYEINDIESEAKEIANAIADGQPFELKRNALLQVYDYQNGRLIERNLMVNDNIQLDQMANKLWSEILKKKTVSAIENIKDLDSDSVIIGVPVIKEDKVIGALFLLFPADEFKTTEKGFALVYATTVIVGTVIIMLYLSIYLKQSRELEKTRKDYIDNVSHELKSPIASIKALTETLIDDLVQDTDTQKRYYEIMLKESNRLEHLIFDMLELSKIQSGKLDFTKKKVSVTELFSCILKKYEVLCDEMGIDFSVDRELNQLPFVETNLERVQQIGTVLLDNAVKFVRENGSINVRFTVSKHHVTVIIHDDGIGIKKEVLPHIFERFVKEDSAHNSKGSGLGLAIAKEIVSGLDEKLWVESEVEIGTTFFFTLKKVTG